ncbi:MAG TPA: 16S rRNA (guanine(527)-N(7))-methyltransferase RsmG [Mesotoga infera]|uniref:Ribosomal RNA small subunit methyltransferase G n=1 Tax=Mesotoga infera TaxID=1236046 RepID=A0A7C1H4T5_9BACT|nr:16S rRNA (guanine(527)-N(7))-methyltransferase RsmG [Mesotoga infera]
MFSFESLEPSLRSKCKMLIELMISSPHNLTSVRIFERAVTVHLEDALIPFADYALDGSYVDIGSGGGIPGLLLATVFPKSSWVLLDSIAKKTQEIERFARRMGLNNVAVKTARAEELALKNRAGFDAAFLRAVARSDVSMELAAPLVRIGGSIFLYKGPGWNEEKRFAGVAEERLRLSLSQEKEYRLSDGSARFLIVYEKKAETPGEFPRRVGMASKSPLGGSK